MSPKEQAQELYKKYYSHLTDVLLNNEAEEFAVVCSLICIDNILDVLVGIDHKDYSSPKIDILKKIDYWKEVEQEIEKL